MKTTITVVKTINEKVEIEYPVFLKDRTGIFFYAFYDESRSVKVMIIDGAKSYGVQPVERYNTIDVILNGGAFISQDEFSSVYNIAVTGITELISKVSMWQTDSTEQSPNDLADAKADRESEMKSEDKSIQEINEDSLPS